MPNTFAMPTNTRKKKMSRERSVDDLKKGLDAIAFYGHHVPERMESTIDCDFSHSPLPLDPGGQAISLARPQLPTWMSHPTTDPAITDRLRRLMEELSRQDPQSAEQLSNATTQHEFLSAVCRLFNLSRALTFSHLLAHDPTDLADTIVTFINRTLHTGPTLKTLARFLGYSEKYCSDLFRSTVGESFSCYLKRRRTERAAALLKTTDKSVAEIADALGFSDQFTFSHFFKRSTGQSPRAFRTTKTRRRPLRAQFSSTQETHRFPSD